jgi:alkyl hydroperoxide reductase subunit AhpC
VGTDNETVHDIIIIDPNKIVKTIFSYPVSVGAYPAEVLRVLETLQTPDQSVCPASYIIYYMLIPHN